MCAYTCTYLPRQRASFLQQIDTLFYNDLDTINSAELGEVGCTETRGRIPARLGGEAERARAASVRATAGDIVECGSVGVEGGVGPADGGLAGLGEEVVEQGEAGGEDGCRGRGSTNYLSRG